MVAWIAGCVVSPAGGPQPEPPVVSHGGPLTDYVSLVDHLRATGAAVEPAGEISQAFFSVKGQVIKVNGNDVQVFEYESEAAAEVEARLVSPNGSSIGTTMVTWVSTPHFFKASRLIVLYVGDDATTLSTLEVVLGPQFAGGGRAQLPPAGPEVPAHCVPQDANTAQYINVQVGYCLTYPARFEVDATDPTNISISGPAIGEGPEPL
jgi:hypothetical protein